MKKYWARLIREFNKNKLLFLVGLYLIAVSFLLGMYAQQLLARNKQVSQPLATITPAAGPNLEVLQEKVLPQKGYVFKIKWGDLGKRMVEDGVIDETKLAKAVTGTEKMPQNFQKYLDGTEAVKIELNQGNAHFWVDMLWALGLANKNKILDEGPMMKGGKAANFASTGGYALSKTQPMDYYSKFDYIKLSESQQKIVEEIAGNVYRPCCGNSTAFPDCNHGMAALGLIELMVSQNFSRGEIFSTVLAFNAYWFPQTYLDIAYHFAKNNRDYKQISASELLSKTFSSAMGYQALRKQVGEVAWPLLKKGGGCGA